MSDKDNFSIEQRMKLYQADLIEIADEHLTYMIESWMFKHGKAIPEEVKNFIAFCREEHKEQMHCKRGKDNKSFHERREDAKAYAKRIYEREKERLERKKNPYYEDERFCENCQKDTMHNCKDTDHERDSSGDYQECLTCKWYLTGYDRKYNPPIGE